MNHFLQGGSQSRHQWRCSELADSLGCAPLLVLDAQIGRGHFPQQVLIVVPVALAGGNYIAYLGKLGLQCFSPPC